MYHEFGNANKQFRADSRKAQAYRRRSPRLGLLDRRDVNADIHDKLSLSTTYQAYLHFYHAYHASRAHKQSLAPICVAR